MQLSPHFTLEELTFSEVGLRRGIANKPPDVCVANLQRLCMTLLEPAREILEIPLHINSGFRSVELNEVLGGAHRSAHLLGLAADFVPIGWDIRAAFDTLRAEPGLPYDQLIFECSAWIHLSAPAHGLAPRRQALTATGRAGEWTYQLVG
jgi:zinc D-Ala-D-Ala carboxypeptidase